MIGRWTGAGGRQTGPRTAGYLRVRVVAIVLWRRRELLLVVLDTSVKVFGHLELLSGE